MAKRTVPPDVRRAIKAAKGLVEYIAKTDGNEAETRQRVERIFEKVMGYDIALLSREYAVKGAGMTEHVDFAVLLEANADAKPVIMVELKRVGVDLASKHLRQVSTYAINAGCEWVLLTNGRDWRLYHVEFGQPPITKLVDQWNLLKDDIHVLAKKFDLLSFKSVRRGSLKKLLEKTTALAPESILAALLSSDSLRQARRVLRKKTDVLVDVADLVSSFRRLLNETAAKTLDELKLDIGDRGSQGRASNAKTITKEGPGGKFKCEFCNREFKSKLALGIHVGSQHKDKKKVTAPSVSAMPGPLVLRDEGVGRSAADTGDA